MELVSEDAVRRYLEHDVINQLMDACTEDGDEELVCQRWLRDSAAKRMVFERLYGDLLRKTKGLRILDVGGGITCFTRLLARRHHYGLIELLAHGAIVKGDEDAQEAPDIHVVDWHDFTPSVHGYDIVIANDLLPNVDQRLQLFLEKFLPVAREVRLSLTFYPQPRFYLARRLDGEEIFCMLAWDGQTTARVLDKFADRLVAPNLVLLAAQGSSAYPNGRQVCLVRLRGDLAPAAGESSE